MARNHPAAAFMDEGGKLPWPFAWIVQVTRGSFGTGLSPAIWAAQEVTIPTEATTFENFGQTNRGGWMPGYGVIERESFLSRSVIINFFDLGKEDPEWDFARPWLSKIADTGLAGSDGQSLQDGTIICQLFNNDGGNPRRTITAKNAFPTHCEGFTVNYGSQPFTVKSVTFACRKLDNDGSQKVV